MARRRSPPPAPRARRPGADLRSGTIRPPFLVALAAAVAVAGVGWLGLAWPPARALLRAAFTGDDAGAVVPPDLAAPEAGALPDPSRWTWLGGTPGSAGPWRAGPTVLALVAHDDPRAEVVLGAAQEWHDAYAPLGVRVIGLMRSTLAATGDTGVAVRRARAARVTFPIAWEPAGDHAGRAPHDPRGATAAGPQVLVADAAGVVRFRAGCDELPWADLALRRLIARRPAAPRDAAAPDTSEWDPRRDCGAPRRVDLAAARLERGPLARAPIDRVQAFTTQFRYQEEGATWVPAPVGRWIPRAEGVECARGGAADFVAIRYHAGAVDVIASPPKDGPAKLWILLDDGWLSADALGADARLEPGGGSYVEVSEPRLYRIATGAGEHVLRLSPARAGLTLHALVFENPSGPGRP